MFTRLRRGIDHLICLLFPTIVMGIGGGLFFHLAGCAIGSALGFALTLTIGVSADRLLTRIYCAKPLPLLEGYKRALMELIPPGFHPEILCVPSALPEIWAVRGLFQKNGRLLVSQGLLAVAKEGELELSIQIAMRALTQTTICLYSIERVLFYLLLRLAPTGWRSLFFSKRPIFKKDQSSLSPINMVWFLLLYPLLRKLNGLVPSSAC